MDFARLSCTLSRGTTTTRRLTSSSTNITTLWCRNVIFSESNQQQGAIDIDKTTGLIVNCRPGEEWRDAHHRNPTHSENLGDNVGDSRPVESERVVDPTKGSDKEWFLVKKYHRREPRDTGSVVDHRMAESEVARAEEKQVKSTRRKYEEKKRVRFTPSSYFENNPIVVKI